MSLGPEGAKVFIINSSTNSIIGTTTTEVDGYWTYDAPRGVEVDVIFEYDDGQQKYNTYSSPYVKVPQVIDDFEAESSGDTPLNWDVQNAVVTNSTSLSGSNSLRNDYNASSGQYIIRRTGLSASPTEITYSYRETSSSGGIGYKIFNGSGNEILNCWTTNPQVGYKHGGGDETLYSSPDPNYNTWRTFDITLDWSNNSFDLTWKDIGGSTNDVERTNKSFINNSSEISQVWLGHISTSTTGDANPTGGNEWIDEIWGDLS